MMSHTRQATRQTADAAAYVAGGHHGRYLDSLKYDSRSEILFLHIYFKKHACQISPRSKLKQ